MTTEEKLTEIDEFLAEGDEDRQPIPGGSGLAIDQAAQVGTSGAEAGHGKIPASESIPGAIAPSSTRNRYSIAGNELESSRS
jgi:hypothetical protein